MRSIVRATAMLSSSSLIGILLGLASSKILATVLHPAGYGYYGVLQSFILAGSLLVGIGTPTGLVRMGATAAKNGEDEAVFALSNGAWLLYGAMTLPLIAAFYFFRAPLSYWILGSTEHAADMLPLGIALAVAVALNVQNGIMNAWHRVEALASYGVVNAVGNASVGIGSVLLWGERGIVPAVVISSFTSWFASRYFLMRSVGKARVRIGFRKSVESARALFAFGVPYSISVMVGKGVQYAMPLVVLHLLNAAGVGYYKAAATITIGYLGFLVTAMTQDYYPRVSAVKDDPKAMTEVINEQHRLIILLAAPVILGTMTLASWVIPLIYSSSFLPTVDILEWQLIGDILRLSSWTMSYAILARFHPSIYFLSEAVLGAGTLLTTWGAIRYFGLAGLGISFVITYVLFYVVVWIILRRELQLRWTKFNRNLMIAVLSAAALIRLLPSTPLASFRIAIGVVLTVGFGVFAARTLWRESKTMRVSETKQIQESITETGK